MDELKGLLTARDQQIAHLKNSISRLSRSFNRSGEAEQAIAVCFAVTIFFKDRATFSVRG